jgi:valyl-tRNA synthetase
MAMDKAYDHKTVEDKIYKNWEEKGYFKPTGNGKPYSIVLPPPNVTGTLHMGHALMLVIEDILVRYHRMRGDKTLWLPGTDHAAIATNAKVEAILWKEEQKTKDDLGRTEFLKRVEAFALASHDTIVTQMRKMGASVDWSREAYTFDEERNFAVRTAFKQMYDAGLIYKGARIVNWDPKLKTTVSDDEIEWKEEKAPFYYFQYGPFVIGTARPETKFGDKYVVMHPKDKRYTKYKHGDKVEVEWIKGKVTATIIKDEAVDMDFGTGVMTITPWHDRTDFEIAERHNLDKEQIIDFRGILLPIAGELAGQHIKKARPMIVEKLKEKGLLVKVDENYIHRIATNSRGGGMIEPQIKEQWFVAVNKEFTMGHSEIEGIKEGDSVTLKKLMRHVVESGQIKVTPSHFVKIYYHWIDNLRDWCISRQIWFGHQVPVWYKDKEVYCDVEPPKGDGWTQDPDTLDTWFSSGLWTFSTMGWPNETEDIKNFHPTDVLETGYDILFFWVARMILMTTYLRGQIPFRDVLLHGLVRDAQKQKMSKSKGNIIDPLDLSAQYGTDALRIALIFSTAAGNDIPMSEDKIRGMKFFSNKLWNMARFIEMKGEGFDVKIITDMSELKKFAEHENDRDMIGRLGMLKEVVTEHIEKFRLHDAAQTLYQYAWHEFADDYIEDVKNRVDEKSITVLRSLFVVQLKLLHPFMPFITEEIYQKMPGHGESLMIESWPQTG